MTEAAHEVEDLVLAAIEAVQSGDRDKVSAAYEALAPIEAGEVIAEILVRLDDLTDGVEVDALLEATTLPVPPDPQRVLVAAASRDLVAMQAATGSDRPELLFATLLVLAAALDEARPRI